MPTTWKPCVRQTKLPKPLIDLVACTAKMEKGFVQMDEAFFLG